MAKKPLAKSTRAKRSPQASLKKRLLGRKIYVAQLLPDGKVEVLDGHRTSKDATRTAIFTCAPLTPDQQQSVAGAMTRTVKKALTVQKPDTEPYFFFRNEAGNVWYREGISQRPDQEHLLMNHEPIHLDHQTMEILQQMFDQVGSKAFEAGKEHGIEIGRIKGERKAWKKMINRAIRELTEL